MHKLFILLGSAHIRPSLCKTLYPPPPPDATPLSQSKLLCTQKIHPNRKCEKEIDHRQRYKDTDTQSRYAVLTDM